MKPKQYWKSEMASKNVASARPGLADDLGLFEVGINVKDRPYGLGGSVGQ
jgi:hypothetical protein